MRAFVEALGMGNIKVVAMFLWWHRLQFVLLRARNPLRHHRVRATGAR